MALKIDITEAQSGFLQDRSRICRFMSGISGGKSFILTLFALMSAMRGRTVLYLLPTYNMINDIAMPTLNNHLDLLGIRDKVHITLSPPTLTIGKGVIYFRSAETSDRLRGLNIHDLACDEAGYIDENVYMIALGRVRKSDDGMIRLVGTPTGASHWYSKLDIPTYKTTTMANPFVPDVFKADLIKQYTAYGEEFLRQELFGDIISKDESSVFITQQLINKGLSADIHEDPSEPTVMGLDVAASLTGDESVAVIRQGKIIRSIHRWRIKDPIDLAQAVSDIIYANNIKAVVVDAPGVGSGVIAGLKRTLEGSGCNIMEFWGWNPSSDPNCANKRAEMYARTRKWIEDGGRLCDDNWEQLSYSRWIQDNKGRILMEPKDNIRKRHGCSPDLADALTLSMDYISTQSASASALKGFDVFGSGDSW